MATAQAVRFAVLSVCSRCVLTKVFRCESTAFQDFGDWVMSHNGTTGNRIRTTDTLLHAISCNILQYRVMLGELADQNVNTNVRPPQHCQAELGESVVTNCIKNGMRSVSGDNRAWQ